MRWALVLAVLLGVVIGFVVYYLGSSPYPGLPRPRTSAVPVNEALRMLTEKHAAGTTTTAKGPRWLASCGGVTVPLRDKVSEKVLERLRSPPDTGRPVKVLRKGRATVALTDKGFIVYERRGRQIGPGLYADLWLKHRGTVMVAPAYAYVNETYAYMVYKLPLPRVNESLPASLEILDSGHVGIVDFNVTPRGLVLLNFDYHPTRFFYDADWGDRGDEVEALERVTNQTLAELRAVLAPWAAKGVAGCRGPRALGVLYGVGLWLQENARYWREKVRKPWSPGVESPEMFLRTRRGICSDYAVFTAAALEALNVSPSYLVIYWNKRLDWSHAVAGVAVNGTIVVLDLTIPYALGQSLGMHSKGLVSLEVIEYRTTGNGFEIRAAGFLPGELG